MGRWVRRSGAGARRRVSLRAATGEEWRGPSMRKQEVRKQAPEVGGHRVPRKVFAAVLRIGVVQRHPVVQPPVDLAHEIRVEAALQEVPIHIAGVHVTAFPCVSPIFQNAVAFVGVRIAILVETMPPESIPNSRV